MRTRVVRTLAIGFLVGGLLAGCATTMSQQDVGGVPNAENPEFLAHPFRLLALGASAAGNVLQYGVVEPLYFVMNEVPVFVGLSLEEQQYIQEREEAWQKYFAEHAETKE